MKILVTGGGKSGSWKIRAEQLGAAIGATVEMDTAKFAGFDLAILVKRPRPGILEQIKKHGTPIVWDVVDAWPQPVGNEWSKDSCMRWLKDEVNRIGPKAIVTTTKAMAADCAWTGLPVLALPHHARPDQPKNPVREKVQTVGYEGGLKYLGLWLHWFGVECAARGWKFIVNPAALSELDIVVAVRVQHGYAPKTWKSNVKLANAQGTGTPCVMNHEAGYMETASSAECWADDFATMAAALTQLKDHNERKMRSQLLYEYAPQLEEVASCYKEWLYAL